MDFSHCSTIFSSFAATGDDAGVPVAAGGEAADDGGAATEGDERDVVLVAPAHDRGNLLRALRPHDARRAAPGRDPSTMPQPAYSRTVSWDSITAPRRAMPHSPFPAASSHPTGPAYGPRSRCSSLRISAPVS